MGRVFPRESVGNIAGKAAQAFQGRGISVAWKIEIEFWYLGKDFDASTVFTLGSRPSGKIFPGKFSRSIAFLPGAGRERRCVFNTLCLACGLHLGIAKREDAPRIPLGD